MYYRWARVGIGGKLIALHSSNPVMSGAHATCVPNLIHGGTPSRHTAPSPWCACGWYATRDVRVLASYWCARDWVLLAVEPYGRCYEDRHGTVRSEYQHIYWAAVPDCVYVESGTIDGVPIVDRDPASILTDMLPPRLVDWIGRPLSDGDYVWLSLWATYTSPAFEFGEWQSIRRACMAVHALHALRGTRVRYTIDAYGRMILGRGRRRLPADALPSIGETSDDGYRTIAQVLNGRNGDRVVIKGD
jgi:hypothetical protein